MYGSRQTGSGVVERESGSIFVGFKVRDGKTFWGSGGVLERKGGTGFVGLEIGKEEGISGSFGVLERKRGPIFANGWCRKEDGFGAPIGFLERKRSIFGIRSWCCEVKYGSVLERNCVVVGVVGGSVGWKWNGMGGTVREGKNKVSVLKLYVLNAALGNLLAKKSVGKDVKTHSFTHLRALFRR